MNKDLYDLWDTAWWQDMDCAKSGILSSQIEDFCSKWEAYAPSLCKFIKDNEIDPLGLDECKALFATEIQKADRLFSKDQRKKEIRESSIAFHL